MATKNFTINVEYFKVSGKYYSSGTFDREFTNIGDDKHPSCCMYEVIDYLRQLRQDNQPVPGLSGSGKGFFIRIDCEEGYPCLIYPELSDEAMEKVKKELNKE